MKPRSLQRPLAELCFAHRKMAFVSGPRQCGKTTMADLILEARGAGAYHNWDDVKFRRIWVKDPGAAIPPPRGEVRPLAVFDEIHKAKGWKRTLKGIYDTLKRPVDILVTGSARLNVYRRGGDSLLGRYHHFRLHPFSLREVETDLANGPQDLREKLFSRSLHLRAGRQETLSDLMEYGPFPGPLFAQSARQAKLWRKERIERVIREDLRDLTRTLELSQIEMLASLLPERVGSPLSLSSLAGLLEVSPGTVKRWITSLRELFYLFDLRPFVGSIARSLRKEPKIYLWDPSEVPDRAARFENLLAGHLLKACHYWTDTGEGTYELHYLRDKERREIDFLITRDGVPWLPVEAKLGDPTPSPNWQKFLRQLPSTWGVQVCLAPGHWRIYEEEGRRLLVASAAEVLSYLV